MYLELAYGSIFQNFCCNCSWFQHCYMYVTWGGGGIFTPLPPVPCLCCCHYLAYFIQGAASHYHIVAHFHVFATRMITCVQTSWTTALILLCLSAIRGIFVPRKFCRCAVIWLNSSLHASSMAACSMLCHIGLTNSSKYIVWLLVGILIPLPCWEKRWMYVWACTCMFNMSCMCTWCKRTPYWYCQSVGVHRCTCWVAVASFPGQLGERD